MNLPSSPKQALSELPQLLLERSEIDDDIDNNSSKPRTPRSVREAGASSVSRWQWKFWKKAPPASPKQQRYKQRKHSSTGVLLTPLPPSVSPGRHNARCLGKLDSFIDDIAEREAARSSPPRPHPADTSGLKSSGSPLPPLEAHILQRPRLVFDLNGCPTVASEQLVRLQEHIEPDLPMNVLQLASIPKKCAGGDEIALMPCHSLQHRGYEMLSAELWREPIRDRDKRWLQDEMPMLLRGLPLRTAPWSMTEPPGASNRGKWARTSLPPDSPTRPAKRPQRVLLRAQGTLISRSYCVVSIFGEGIYGRLYGAGLTGKDKKRCLRVEAYEPATSRTYSLRVTLQDLEWLFRVGGDDPAREALLAPGRKQELLRQLVALLYFEYPDDSSDADAANSFRQPNETREEPGKTELPVLRISPQLQLNESALRRLEREERLRQEEARRLEDLAALLSRPRRARHRVLCQPLKLRGRPFYVSVYHFPSQARNLVLTAYNPSSSRIYRLSVGLLEAASLVKLYPFPRSGFRPEQTVAVARGLIPQLRLHGREDSRSNARMMLAIHGGRKGPGMDALPLLRPVVTEEQKHDELFSKMLRDSQRSLQLELEMAQLRLHIDAGAERADLRRRIAEVEAKRAERNEKDQTLKIRIEEIDASGGASADQKRLHEERRAHKVARQALKGETKAAAAQLEQLNQQLQDMREKEKAASERAQRRADRARKRIRDEVMKSVAAALPLAVPLKPRHPAGQRTWLAKTHMQPGRTLLSSGSCRVSGKRVRHSLFALEPETGADLDAVDEDCRLFSLELYDPATCSRCTSFVFSKLEWLALTKGCHEQQQLVPELTSDAAKRLVELREQIAAARHELFKMKERPPDTSPSKGKTSKTRAPPSKKKREELQRALTSASNEIHRLSRDAPWPAVVKALCARCTVVPASGYSTAFDVSLDRCIFRAVSPVLRISSEETESENDDDSGAVYCHVRAEVLPLAKAVAFDVWDPLDGMQWRVEYPESRELLREFAVETFVEQQMHLEAIMMSLLLHTNAETGRLELRFEE